MAKTTLTFIDANPLDETHAAQLRREVKSHAARRKDQGAQPACSQRRRGPRRHYRRWNLELKAEPVRERLQDGSIASNSPLSYLSGDTAVPASQSVVYHQTFVPFVVENYLQHLAVAIPEVDGEGQSCLLKTRWFPMVIHSPLIFQVIVLFSASHYAASQGDTSLAATILWLKQWTLHSLAQALHLSRGFTRDELIAATAKLAAYEAIYGDESAYHAHMDGVKKMLSLRGGLEALGLNGLLARLLVFIDTNSAFLLNTRLHLQGSHFPRQAPFISPNPSRFIGAS